MDTRKVVNLGDSLLVPCVQELANSQMDTIPPRYIRQDQDQPIIQNEVSAEEVPVIDMQRLLSRESMDSELTKLHYACKDWGFFQLVNHGVNASLLEKIKKEVQDLFDLPMEEKKKLWQYPGEVEGFGQAFVVAEDQKLDWGDIFFMTTQPVEARKPHLYPNLPLPLRDTLDAYSSAMKNLGMAILAQMAKALEVKTEEITEIFEDGFQSMRMNYYPPCPQPDKVIGLTPHSDASGITILLQVNEVEGLQIKKDGKWVSIKPLPNAFVINIGDSLEIISNGIYRSIEHRAIVNLEKVRISIATFYAPRMNAEIGPALSLIKKQSPALFKRIGVEEYFRSLFARELHSKSHLDTLRI